MKLREDLPKVGRFDDVMLPSGRLPSGLGDSPFAWRVLGRPLLHLALQAALLMAAAVLVDRWGLLLVLTSWPAAACGRQVAAA